MVIAASEILGAAHRSTLVLWSFYLGQLTASRTFLWTLKVIISICSYVVSKSKFSHHSVCCYVFALHCALFLQDKLRSASGN
jgi:hypothetical protein